MFTRYGLTRESHNTGNVVPYEPTYDDLDDAMDALDDIEAEERGAYTWRVVAYYLTPIAAWNGDDMDPEWTLSVDGEDQGHDDQMEEMQDMPADMSDLLVGAET